MATQARQKGALVNTEPSRENLLALWNRIRELGVQLTDAQATITSQQSLITSLTTQQAATKQAADQALILAGKAASQSAQGVPPAPGGGGGGGSDPGNPPSNHDSQYAVVQAVIADLVAHGIDLSGPCGSFAVTNEVVKWLRPSQPDVGIIHKPSGTNCGGYSIDAIMYLDGAVFDLLINAENAPATGAAPDWRYAGQRPASDWRDPI